MKEALKTSRYEAHPVIAAICKFRNSWNL